MMVSISCLSYNQAPYIRQCLDSFLMQQTDFPFEILIHDDASTDGTIAIIEEYASKYPDKIFPIIQTENQFSKGVRGIMAKYNFPRAKGKYIALCEGDDYWTDPQKLQKQVDFLEGNPNFSLCFHDARDIFQDGSVAEKTYCSPLKKQVFTTQDIVGFINIPTVSVMFRNSLATYKESCLLTPIGDWPLYMLLSKFGNFYFIKEEMGMYRKHSAGINSLRPKTTQNLNKLKAIEVVEESEEFRNNKQVKALLIDEKLRLIYYQSLLYIRNKEFIKSLNFYFKLLFGSPLLQLGKSKLSYPYKFFTGAKRKV